MAVDYDSKKYLESVDAYWRAANYLSVGTLYLMGDPLLRQPLKATCQTNPLYILIINPCTTTDVLLPIILCLHLK